jgi:plastocyanin
VVLALAPACGGGEEEPGSSIEQSAELEAFDYYFEPTALMVELGAEVTIEFTNNGSVSHSFSAPDLDVEVEAGNGEEATVTFTVPDQPGSFDFFCKYHADQMAGTISIGGGEAPLEEDPDETDEDDEDVEIDVDDDNDAGAGSDDNY